MIVLYSEVEDKLYLKLGDAILDPVYDQSNGIHLFKVLLNKKGLKVIGKL